MPEASFPAPIVYLSNAHSSYGLPTNRQQLPRYLARHTRVLFASPFSMAQALVGHVQWSSFRPHLREDQPNLFAFDNFQLLPMVRARVPLLRQIDEAQYTRRLKDHIDRLGLHGAVLWTYYPPSQKHLFGRLGERLRCYHCTDDHAGYAKVMGLDDIRVAAEEEELVRSVDVVFVTSRPLYEAKVVMNPRTYLMENVADVPAFTAIAEGRVRGSPDIAHVPRPIAGFIGAIDAYKIDMELVERVAALMPDWSFVFVGPIGLGDATDRQKLPRLPNLRFLGGRPYATIPSYVASFDVCLIPYAINEYTSGVFPLKFWEYLASGRPVVSTPIPSLSAYGALARFGGTAAEFEAAIRCAFAEDRDHSLSSGRVEFAADHSWARQAERMLDALRELLK